MGKKDLFLEDAVLDDLAHGLEVVERPLSGRVFVVVGLLALVIAAVVLVRSMVFGVFSYDAYANRAYANAGQQVLSSAPRGIIYDRFGTPLVSNEPSFSAHVNLSEILRSEKPLDENLEILSNIVLFDIEEVKQEILSANLEREAYVPFGRDLSLGQVIELRKQNLPFVVVEESFSRIYENGEVFSHLVGYTGFTSLKDVAQQPNLNLNDEIGKTGLEAWYDEELRGEKGLTLLFQDAMGNVVETTQKYHSSVGNDVYTTIDSPLQEKLYNTMSSQLRMLGRRSGAGIIFNPQTGAIRAMVSFPSYDNNNLSAEIFSDSDQPLFNRVISGLYAPGSTIKPLVAVAALAEGVVTPYTSIYSAGYIEVPNPYNPSNPSRFVDWKAHGWVDMFSALARSSNVYFYEVGGGFEQQEGLGIYRLHEYWELFGLGEQSGIDLFGEAEGVLPTPEWKEKKRDDIWRVGDTYNVSIGQGDLLVTPLALIRYIAVLASGGILPTPHLVEDIVTDSGEINYEWKDSGVSLGLDESDVAVVEEGMQDAVYQYYGTASRLADIPLSIAAKTGSAQVASNTKTNAFFVGYTIPKGGEEQIAMLILIEDAREGSLNAVPVAAEIFEWYYTNRVSNTD